MDFKLRLEPSGLELDIHSGESILDAALRQDVNLPYGCRNGVCGACKGKLLSGNIDYADSEPDCLSEEELSAGIVLFCKAVPTSDVRIEAATVNAISNLEISKLAVRVTTLERLAPDVMRLLLKLPDRQRMPFFAGQYIDILLNDGRRRSFSIANAPHVTDSIELHIRHVKNGDYSAYVFNEMEEQEILRIEGPFGNFYLREDSHRPIILVAGGTGFAPIKGLIEHAMAVGVSRPMFLYWGVQARQDLYLHELAQDWTSRMNLEYRPVLSDPHRDDHWQGRQGLVNDAVLEDFPDLSNYEVYSCGPPPMIKTGYSRFVMQGLPENRFFSDAFEYANDGAASQDSDTGT